MNDLADENFLTNPEKYLRNVGLDNIIFGYHDKELKVLLQQPLAGGKWTVSGGFIKKTESIEEAAKRIALERTGLENLFLEQFRSFGNPKRNTDSEFSPQFLSAVTGSEIPTDFWIFDYIVSVGFYTLTEFAMVQPKKNEHEADCCWWPISNLPPMMFDHHLMITEALKTLRMHIAHYPIGYILLPEKFTLPEIHALYETILDKSMDDRNFTRQLMATGIIVKLNETKRIGAHRSPFLYKFDKEKYDQLLENGILFVF